MASTEDRAELNIIDVRGHCAVPDEPQVAIDLDGTVLVVGARSAAWRRQLGPLAWSALVHLALASHLDYQGWAAPMGSGPSLPASESPKTERREPSPRWPPLVS